MAIIILLLHCHVCHRGCHLSMVMNGVKGTQEAYLWVPVVCFMVENVYINDTAWDVFTKRQLLQCS
jgi:hypothetical protein